MGVLKRALRAFAKKHYEADLVMAIYVRTPETRSSLVNDFVYAAVKTRCADRSDIIIGNTEVGYYLIMVKSTRPMRVLRSLVTVCNNRYFTQFVYAVRHQNGWLLSAKKSIIGIEMAVDQTKDWVEFWYSDSSVGGEVLSVPKSIRVYPCLALVTDAEDAEVDAERRRYEELHEGKRPPFFYTFEPEKSPADPGPEIPEFVLNAQRERKTIKDINRSRLRPQIDYDSINIGSLGLEGEEDPLNPDGVTR